MKAKKLTIAEKKAQVEFKKMVKMLDARITKGIKFLDDKFGRMVWLPRINEAKLDLESGNTCMTGQAYDGHWDEFLESMEKKVLGKSLDDFDDSDYDDDDETAQDRAQEKLHKFAASLGFYLTNQDEEDKNLKYDVLTRLWFARVSIMKMEAGLEITKQPPIANYED